MRIAFCWDWPIEFTQAMTWKDGLAAALKELRTRHELEVFACADVDIDVPHAYFPIRGRSNVVEAVTAFIPDVILVWGDTTRPNAPGLAAIGKPMALCFAGGDTDREMAQYFDHFFVESAVYADRLLAAGHSVSTAFGTNTELFTPSYGQKFIDVVFPATYCDWKRHNLLTDATVGINPHLRVVCAGYQYEKQEQDCYRYPKSKGILTLPHVSAETLRELYDSSKVCVVTSRNDGGSQRTVLEAMAMNIPVVVMDDSEKTTEYVREAGGVNRIANHDDVVDIHHCILEAQRHAPMCKNREYIMSKWTEKHYANALEEGLKNLL